MRHLLEFESYEGLDEAGIPVYNADDFRRSPSNEPEDEISTTKIFSYISDLLDQQKDGQVEEISMTVDLPMQGKKAPQHVLDTLDAERKRIEKRNETMYFALENMKIKRLKSSRSNNYDFLFL